MAGTIVFIHGEFLTPKCWEPWRRYFSERGYRCVAPAWPWHDGDPEALRERIPVETGHLALRDIVEELTALCRTLAERPILIGHSLGGLVVQVLVNRGLAKAGVCISSSPPNGMLALDWDFLKSRALIANPLRGDKPYLITEREFGERFCNTMTREQTRAAYLTYAVHESRNVLRGSLGAAGRVDLRREHAPLLFIAGGRDRFIPEKLDKKNAEAYAPEAGVVDFKEFPGSGHFICGEPRWEEVASYVEGWLAAEPWISANRLGASR
ncbi:MAG TPA: alpha/beta hydrolase [Elusimicrobiota bacterium]|nr:alpha/beta hydrolase [Elusimicrobiota bacterium]